MQAGARAVSRQRTADFVVLLVLAGLAATYGIDAFNASRNVLNLIMVLPLTVIVLALCVVQFVVEWRKGAEAERAGGISDILPAMGLFTAYVLTLEWLGFDVGTFLFVAVFLWLHGERRWSWLVAYALAFAAVLSIFFSTMLPYPMPMLVLESAY